MGRGWKRARKLSTAPVPYPTSQSSRREGHPGGRPSPVVECHGSAQTASAVGGRLQRLVAGLTSRLWRGPWRRLRTASQMATKRSTPILLRSNHAPARKEMTQQPTLLAPFHFQIADSDLVRAAAA